MAELQKGKPFAFGAQTVTTASHTNSASTVSLKMVIENAAPVITADKLEFRDGDGDVDGLIYTNQRTTLDIEFYISDTDITTSEGTGGTNRAFAPGDKLTFNDQTFPEIHDGTAPDTTNVHAFVIDEITKSRSFGNVRKISLRMTEYANDVSASITS